MKANMTRLLIIIVLLLIQDCGGDDILDMLSPFIDLEGLAEQAATEASRDAATNTKSSEIDDTYPLAPVELNVLLQMHRECRTAQSKAMRTWCVGSDKGSYLGEEDDSNLVCPHGVLTDPCTGRVLDANNSTIEEGVEFLWPWEGIKCDNYTDPTTVTQIYLQGEGLNCELTELDLSVMVSLEDLDLSRNQLSGVFPEWLGEMTLLRLLNLEGNELRRDIPSSFADNAALELMNLSGNNLTASTLRFFDAFHRLQYLDLSSNDIELELPRNLFASEFLQTINLSHNLFHGGLPELPVFQFLVSLDLSSNMLTGEIPLQLSLWGREDPHDPDENSTVAIVDISNNFFTGALPVISNQTSLQRFDVQNNDFSGFLPEFPPSLLKHAKPAQYDGNAFFCPMIPVLLPSNLTCVCGNGYSTNSSVDSSNYFGVVIPANNASSLCLPCPEGSYSNTTTNQKCRSCPAGSTPEISASGKADHCRLCLPGTYTNESGSQNCMACSPGTFANDIGAISCEACSPGEFAAADGSTECTECSVGSFSSSFGAVVCASCPTGTYTKAEGEAECLMCPIDTFQDVNGSVECKTCPVGYIAPQPGHAKCSPCLPGSFYDAKANKCTLCYPDTFTKVQAQMECSKCENGTVAEGFGNDKCLAVAAPGWGYLSTTSTESPVKCNSGEFNDGTWRTCQSCLPGAFSAAKGSQNCSSCPKGSFSSSKGSSYGEKSPAGSFVDFEGAERAELCPPNFIAAVNGSVNCIPCQVPTFSFLYGGVECSIAMTGEVYDHVTWPRIALDLVGVAQHELLHTRNADHVPALTALVQVWTDTLTSFSASRYQLDVLEVTELGNSSYLTRVVVAVETTILSPKKTEDANLQNKVGDAIQQATEAAENELNNLLQKLNGSYEEESDENNVEEVGTLMTTAAFQDTLVRQLNRVKLFGGVLSFSLLNLSTVDPPFNSTRAVACAPGTFFILTEAVRECRPCPMGSYSSTSGALECKLCRRGTFSAEEGQTECSLCPNGADAAEGATRCTKCSWFTFECEGFWEDLVVAICIAGALLRMAWKKIRRFCAGDQGQQQQDEGVALMAAVRAHGRTFDGVQYAPMGTISADTMFGSTSSSKLPERL